MKVLASSMVCALALLVAPAQGQDAGPEINLAELLQTPLQIERAEPSSTIPFERRFGKMVIEASVNGEGRSFIFDTGSPTVISRQFAEELGLQPIATNRGRDANGAIVEMQFAIAETITLGGTTFHDVPVLIHDFTTVEMGSCVFDGGVIGSEIFPQSIWQFDAANSHIRISAPQNTPSYSPSGRISARMVQSGYPHPPVIEYRIGDIADRALFDTGSGAGIAIFDDMLESVEVREAITDGSLREGRGSMGVSAGGEGEETSLLRFGFDGLVLGGTTLSNVPAENRAVPPNLLGVAMLDRYRVTLNYPGSWAVFDPLPEPILRPPHAGYGITFRDGAAVVSQIFEGSAPHAAGLTLGDTVLAVDDMNLADLDETGRCDAMHRFVDTDLLRDARTITVLRPGEDAPTTIRIDGD
ncbi:aspartyl protease family protein [Aurantiacibacter sp. MUD61]|uniref:aspartyl protease family protein n=1 Tax=Aurantiacibacter sp. MUD61 TaxID=3009083 RepID=UPI0022F13D02|nr:aspartyl protease family protein [Aurantiacibacter sp. MUD61]